MFVSYGCCVLGAGDVDVDNARLILICEALLAIRLARSASSYIWDVTFSGGDGTAASQQLHSLR